MLNLIAVQIALAVVCLTSWNNSLKAAASPYEDTTAEESSSFEKVATEEPYVKIPFRDNLRFVFKHRKDPYKMFAEIFRKYGSLKKPILFYVPTLGRVLLVFDKKSISQIAKTDNADTQFLKKGFSVEFIRNGLLGSGFAVLEKGDLYKLLHSKITPHFRQTALKDKDKSIEEWSTNYLEKLHAEQGSIVNIEEEMLAFAMGAVSRTMLGYPLEIERAKSLSASLSRLLAEVFEEQLSFYQKIKTIFRAKSFRDNSDFLSIQEFIEEIIEYNRKQKNEWRHDVPQTYSSLVARIMATNKLSKEEKRDQLINIFFGGHETTAHWLASSLYFLSKITAEDYESLRVEVDNYKKGLITLGEMTHLESFTKEALRLDPSVPHYGREVNTSFSFLGINLFPGDKIIISPYAAHHSDECWEDPDDFKSKRFMNLSEIETMRSYIPFGMGGRGCIGKFFAAKEVKLFLIEFLAANGAVTLGDDYTLDTYMVATARFRGGLFGKLSFNEPTE